MDGMLGRLKRHKTTIWGEVHPIFFYWKDMIFLSGNTYLIGTNTIEMLDTNRKTSLELHWELVDELSYLKIMR